MLRLRERRSKKEKTKIKSFRGIVKCKTIRGKKKRMLSSETMILRWTKKDQKIDKK
jgi:hypothetical protein